MRAAFATLDAFGIKRSPSRRGCPYDNAVDESTNKILKVGLLYREAFGTTRELQVKPGTTRIGVAVSGCIRPWATLPWSSSGKRVWFSRNCPSRRSRDWLYLALVMDIWSRRIVGWAMGPNITAELADETLKVALARRSSPRGCIRHSDYRLQYVSLLLSKTMREHDTAPRWPIFSPWDNAAMELLMGPVKSGGSERTGLRHA